MTFSLRRRGNLTANSDVCEAAPRFFVLNPPNRLNELPEVRFECPFNLIGKPTKGLCHTAAILSRETRVAFLYLSSLAPKIFTARSRVVKRSFFSLSGQYGLRVNKAHGFLNRPIIARS